MNRLRIGDEVLVMSGNHKGQKGKVARLDYSRGRVVVEGVNLKKRHLRANQQTTGGIMQIPGALPISCVMPLDPDTGKPTRVRFEDRDGVKVRVAKSGKVIETSHQVTAAEGEK